METETALVRRLQWFREVLANFDPHKVGVPERLTRDEVNLLTSNIEGGFPDIATVGSPALLDGFLAAAPLTPPTTNGPREVR